MLTSLLTKRIVSGVNLNVSSAELLNKHTSFNRNTLYVIRSVANNTFGILLGLPVELGSAHRSYWVDAVLSKHIHLLHLLAVKDLHLCYQADGSSFANDDSSFLNLAVNTSNYIQLYLDNNQLAMRIVNHLGHGYNPTNFNFDAGGGTTASLIPRYAFTQAELTVVPLSTSLANNLRTPSLETEQVSSLATSLTSTYQLNITTASLYAALTRTNVAIAETPMQLAINELIYLSDTKELILSLS